MKNAFTLVELLIVIVIIGILATIAVPQYQEMIERARGGEALSNLGALRRAMEIFYMEHDAYIGTVDNLDVTLTGEQNRTSKNFFYSVWCTYGYHHPRSGTAVSDCRYCIAAIKNAGTLNAPVWGSTQYHLHYNGDIVKTEMPGENDTTPLHTHNDGNPAHTHQLPLDT